MSEPRFQARSGVLARKVGEELILLDLDADSYFGLNEQGARLWQLIESPRRVHELVDALLDEYAAERAVVEHDVQALLNRLQSASLVLRVDESAL